MDRLVKRSREAWLHDSQRYRFMMLFSGHVPSKFLWVDIFDMQGQKNIFGVGFGAERRFIVLLR